MTRLWRCTRCTSFHGSHQATFPVPRPWPFWWAGCSSAGGLRTTQPRGPDAHPRHPRYLSFKASPDTHAQDHTVRSSIQEVTFENPIPPPPPRRRAVPSPSTTDTTHGHNARLSCSLGHDAASLLQVSPLVFRASLVNPTQCQSPGPYPHLQRWLMPP